VFKRSPVFIISFTFILMTYKKDHASNVTGVFREKGIGKPEHDVVLVKFKEATKTYCPTIHDLISMIREWIICEEQLYPQTQACRGRWLLFEAILKEFNS